MKKETFSERVKKEICSLLFEDHCLKALLSSFMSSRWMTVTKKGQWVWRLTSQFPFIIRFLENTFKNLYDVKTETHIVENATNINGLTNYVDVVGNFDQLQHDLGLNDEKGRDIVSKLECCKRAYVAGAYLAGGSINSLESSSHHLEIRSSDWEYLFFIQKMLISFGIYAVLTKHTKKQFILYIKKVNQISDFLKLIGAGNCMLEFEDVKITKDANMSITRWNNLDISNINKSAVAGAQQIKEIKLIQKKTIYQKQSKKFKAFCELRLKYPSSSLTELVVLMRKEKKI